MPSLSPIPNHPTNANTIPVNRRQRRANKQSTFAQAVELHQAGRVAEAEALYRRIIAARPDSAEAVANLGLALQQQGRIEEAIEAHRRAIAIKPDFANAVMNLVTALEGLGRFDEAIPVYRRLLLLMPDTAPLWNNLGVVLQKAGRFEEAIAQHRIAVNLDPGFYDAYYNMSLGLRASNRLEEAATALRQAIAVRPGWAAYHTALGVTLNDLGAREEAIEVHRTAIALDPALSAPHMNLGVALDALGRWEEAAAAHGQAIVLDPQAFKAYDNLGLVLRKLGRMEEAIAAHSQAIAIEPNAEGAHFNLGIFLAAMGRVEEAIASHRRAIAVKPDFAEAHFKLGDNLLKAGHFAEGWSEYEWRWKTKAKVSDVYHLLTQPFWKGERLDGETILLHYEQGLGDTMQFVRYIRPVLDYGGHVILLVQPVLKRLIGTIEGVTVLSPLDAIPSFDVHCPLLSLPRVLATELATIPAAIPYLQAEPEAAERWRTRLAGNGLAGNGLAGNGLKVGLVWSGNPSHVNDAERSMPADRLGPLLDLPGVTLFSLQKDLRGSDEAWAATTGARMTMLGPELTDFAETAAVLAALDVLITVDTSVCHLAGALGRPVWLLLPFASEWRWLTRREDSPWYPTIRLFRQGRIGDWSELMERVAAELSKVSPPARP